VSFTGEPDLLVVACLKAVALVSIVDPLSGQVTPEALSLGASVADLAALEWALRCGQAWGAPVIAVSAGDATAEGVLRDALAAGASEAIRAVSGGGGVGTELSSWEVARSLAGVVSRRLGAGSFVIFCGDASIDRGSGSVPAFLADELGAAQALGLVGVEIGHDDLTVQRRLDGGRREILRVVAPAVLSVEGGSARLRRAPLQRTIEAASVEIMSVDVTTVDGPSVELVDVQPYRPRTLVVPPPTGAAARDRIVALIGAGHEQSVSRALELQPEAAADELLATLRSWGEIS
jgi:electron transfer flavoprotein beta subunit